MRKIFLLLLLFPLALHGANYYVSNTGNDANNGTTTGTPWRTLSKVNSTSFSPGDNIYFRCGDTFRGTLIISSSGNSSNRITYSSYGAGPKPRIIGAVNKSLTSDWTQHSGNVWRTEISPHPAVNDVGNVIFDNDAGCGRRFESVGALTTQGDWTYENSTSRVYLYSASNPGSYYTNIEVGGVYSENVVSAYQRSYVTLDNLHIQYSANNGMFWHNCNNIVIRRCEVSWIGGMWWKDRTKMGNGIQIWNNANGFEVTRCYIHDMYDTGISPQGEGSYTQQNINIHHNIFDRCYWTYEIFLSGSRTISNVSFNNNTCYNAGLNWSVNQRPDPYNARHVRTWGEDGTLSNLSIRNNIFYYSGQTAYAYYYNCPFTSDYNIFYLNTIGWIGSTSYTTLPQWRTATGQDAHSTSTNPLLGADYSPSVNSPGVDAGTNLGYTFDYYGNPIVGTPDIGAIEFQGGVVQQQRINLVIEGHSFVTTSSYMDICLRTQWTIATIGLTPAIYNSAAVNSRIADPSFPNIVDRASTVDSRLVTESASLKNVLVLWIGVFDMTEAAGDATALYNALKNYVQARITAGWKVFVYTMTPSTAGGRSTAFESKRQTFNNLILTDLQLINGVRALNTNTIQELNDPANTTYYSDRLHLTQAGATLACPLFGAALGQMWEGLPPYIPPPVVGTGVVVKDGQIVKMGTNWVIIK